MVILPCAPYQNLIKPELATSMENVTRHSALVVVSSTQLLPGKDRHNPLPPLDCTWSPSWTFTSISSCPKQHSLLKKISVTTPGSVQKICGCGTCGHQQIYRWHQAEWWGWYIWWMWWHSQEPGQTQDACKHLFHNHNNSMTLGFNDCTIWLWGLSSITKLMYTGITF